jgi:hypothetical protein
MDRTVEQLLALDPAGLSIDDQLSLLESLEGLSRRVAARRDRVLAVLADEDPDERDFVREEVACLLRWSHPTAGARMAQAQHVAHRLPATLALHEAGKISAQHVRILAEATCLLDPAVIGKVEARVLERAPEQTPASFRRCVTRAVAVLDTRAVEQRHAEAVRTRRVCATPLPDGMAGLYAELTATDTEAILARVREHAGRAAAGDPRSLDERRADAFVELLLRDPANSCQNGAGKQSGTKPRISIVVPLDAILGWSELPGELAGYGPIPASLCRQALAEPGAQLERFVVAADGTLIDRTRLRLPDAALREWVNAVHRTCRMPGCNRPACTCEADHIEPFNGTNTTAENLEPLCCRHHHVKHDAGWHVERRDDGVAEWTTTTGRRYEKPPDDWPDSTLWAKAPPDPL